MVDIRTLCTIMFMIILSSIICHPELLQSFNLAKLLNIIF